MTRPGDYQAEVRMRCAISAPWSEAEAQDYAISRVAHSSIMDSLEPHDVDSRAPCREDLDRLEKIRDGNFLEFGLSSRGDLDAEEEYWHRMFSLQIAIRIRSCVFVKNMGN